MSAASTPNSPFKSLRPLQTALKGEPFWEGLSLRDQIRISNLVERWFCIEHEWELEKESLKKRHVVALPYKNLAQTRLAIEKDLTSSRIEQHLLDVQIWKIYEKYRKRELVAPLVREYLEYALLPSERSFDTLYNDFFIREIDPAILKAAFEKLPNHKDLASLEKKYSLDRLRKLNLIS